MLDIFVYLPTSTLEREIYLDLSYLLSRAHEFFEVMGMARG